MATLLIVPACLRAWEGLFFPATDSRRTTLFGTHSAVVVGLLAAVLLGVNIQPHLGEMGIILMWILLMTGLPGIVVFVTRGGDRVAGRAERAALSRRK